MLKLRKSTRYALYATLEMAAAGRDRQVSVAQVAEQYAIPGAALAKVFQRLVRSGLAVGTRGAGGGYLLTRPPSRITVLEVVTAFEPERAPGHCLIAEHSAECADPAACRLGRLFDEVDEAARCTLASITLATLVAAPHPELVQIVRRVV